MNNNPSYIFFGAILVIATIFVGYTLWKGSGQDQIAGDLKDNATSSVTSITPGQHVSTTTEQNNLQTSNQANNNKTQHMVTIDTNYGTIVFETYDTDAPNTVANFVKLAEKGFYNG